MVPVAHQQGVSLASFSNTESHFFSASGGRGSLECHSCQATAYHEPVETALRSQSARQPLEHGVVTNVTEGA